MENAACERYCMYKEDNGMCIGDRYTYMTRRRREKEGEIYIKRRGDNEKVGTVSPSA
jgi:hypothetical protein